MKIFEVETLRTGKFQHRLVHLRIFTFYVMIRTNTKHAKSVSIEMHSNLSANITVTNSDNRKNSF
jgi:hypothetical protein